MHQQIITFEQFAAITQALEVFGRAEKAGCLTLIGRHSRLGVCVLTTGAGPGAALLSQIPPQQGRSSTEPHVASQMAADHSGMH
jgi:hypothetical protein